VSLYTLALFNRPVDWFHCVNCGLVIPDGDLCTLCINEALAMEREYAPDGASQGWAG